MRCPKGRLITSDDACRLMVMQPTEIDSRAFGFARDVIHNGRETAIDVRGVENDV